EAPTVCQAGSFFVPSLGRCSHKTRLTANVRNGSRSEVRLRVEADVFIRIRTGCIGGLINTAPEISARRAAWIGWAWVNGSVLVGYVVGFGLLVLLFNTKPVF